jgi:hypothetical protein
MNWEFISPRMSRVSCQLAAVVDGASLSEAHKRLLADDPIWRRPKIRPLTKAGADAYRDEQKVNGLWMRAIEP